MIGGLDLYLFVIVYSRSLRYFVDVEEKLFRQQCAVKSADFCLQSADRARWPGDVFEVMFPGDSANHCLFTASCAAPLPGTTPSHPHVLSLSAGVNIPRGLPVRRRSVFIFPNKRGAMGVRTDDSFELVLATRKRNIYLTVHCLSIITT